MFKRNQIETELDKQIDAVQEAMATEDPKSEEFAKMVKQFAVLMEIRRNGRISMETAATIGANLAGIMILMNHERAHVIASKTFGLIRKLF